MQELLYTCLAQCSSDSKGKDQGREGLLHGHERAQEAPDQACRGHMLLLAFVIELRVSYSILVFCRRDKYERHLREYWVDVKAMGSLATVHSEIASTRVVIEDPDMEFPEPVLTNSPMPNLGDDGDHSNDQSDSGEESEASAASPNKKAKKPSTSNEKKRRTSSNPGSSRPSKKPAQSEKRKPEEIEEALEDR